MLKERFLDLLTPPLPSDWEIEEYLDRLAHLPERRQKLILRQVRAIWPVSNSLCYSYLTCADAAFSCLNEAQISGWVATILDIYEKKGLKAAQTFMTDVEKNYLCLLRGETGVRLSDVGSLLLSYGKGVYKELAAIEGAEEVYTDTASIFLPRKLAIFPGEEENFLLYKLMVTSQLFLVKARTYELTIDGGSSLADKLRERFRPEMVPARLHLEDFWNIFPEPRLAEDLITLAEGWRTAGYMARIFPGLWRDSGHLRRELAERRSPMNSLPNKSRVIEALSRLVMTGEPAGDHGLAGELFRPIMAQFVKPAASAGESAAKAISIYALLSALPGRYKPVRPLIYLGRLHPAQARLVRVRKRTAVRDKFIKALAAVLPETAGAGPVERQEESETVKPSRVKGEEASALLINPPEKAEPGPSLEPEEQREPEQLLILDTPEMELTEELKKMRATIEADLGRIPKEYIVAAFGLAGKGEAPPGSGTATEGAGLTGAITYDEWDFRRSGFRKEWCVLNEKRVLPVKGTFVRNTLDKYRGLLIKLKKQFEMLRCTERLIKRQRDGDDIDLDAVIESISDLRAGRPGSEKLFVRLRRDDRDIAVLFLIDMSASTEGWVGDALKEALILMGESLEVLGDRYAIAGFSGMRRTRADFYHIKDFAETYNEEIKGRIAGITPREYTRMGPAVRHATKILQEVEARVKLLIVLSDGKPEDYDDYKGDYAIEDTRHALIEAKAAGIHPFCITIDQQAHDYNAHMYGEVNYIFLDKVSDLPVRMPAIYRNLTT